jgi:hypothetical protein
LTRVKAHSFAAESKVWFALEDLKRFGMELEALEAAPNGAAVLDSAEPDAFQMTILSPGDDVEAVTHVTLVRRHRVGLRDFDHTLVGAFTLPVAVVRHAAKTLARWSDARFLAELESWGFDEKALLDD